MTNTALSPAIMLATSMQAQPGVYAVLLGSGISTGAGLPTGWGIVRQLVDKIAAQMSAGDVDHTGPAAKDPEAWWVAQFGEPLGYSTLLAKLAPTPAARQGILERFFEPDPDSETEPPGPSRAHQALASLVKRGMVRVIITTNFDRLTERALSAAGIEPQVISRPDAVAGMRPLAHAPATVVKLHGDYKDIGSLNTEAELSAYPDAWTTLLARIFDEYGLLISGWSADWDVALVHAIENTPARRYPLYWDRRSSKGDAAQRILTARQGLVIDAPDADQLFTGLVDNVAVLDRLAEPPMTTAMAVARLKKYLPDPLRRIDLYDLVTGQLEPIKATLTRFPASQPLDSAEKIEGALDAMTAAASPLLALLAHGMFHDDNTHDTLWIDILQDLLDLRVSLQTGTVYDAVWHLHHYPALLAFDVLGYIAIAQGRDGFFVRLCDTPRWKSPYGDEERPASDVLHAERVLNGAEINTLPSTVAQSSSGWIYPESHYIKTVLRPIITQVGRPAEFPRIFADLEYRTAVTQWVRPKELRESWPLGGEYLLDRQMRQDVSEVEQRLRAVMGDGTNLTAWWIRAGRTVADTNLLALREELKTRRRW